MSVATFPAVSLATPQLRPLNILRDLPSVADLVETCFADTMDADGHRYVQQMRRAGRDNTFLRWAVNAAETASMPLSGYVWEEDGQIIGNVSLIPFRKTSKKNYLIANVAVRPDRRHRGIGRLLTAAAMQHARRRQADEIWLHVRDDNPGAIALYTNLGFKERARRTSWQTKADRTINTYVLDDVVISSRYARNWPLQESWLRRTYPDFLHWHQSPPWMSLRPGLLPGLYRFFMDTGTRQWSAYSGGKLLASLTWQSLYAYSDRLWVAVPPEGSERVLMALLFHVRRSLTWQKSLNLEFPAGEYSTAIKGSGFHPLRTLLWMQATET